MSAMEQLSREDLNKRVWTTLTSDRDRTAHRGFKQPFIAE